MNEFKKLQKSKKILVILSAIIFIAGIIFSLYQVLDACLNPDEFGFSNLGFIVPFIIMPMSIFAIQCLWVLYFIIVFFKNLILMKDKKKRNIYIIVILLVICILIFNIYFIFI